MRSLPLRPGTPFPGSAATLSLLLASSLWTLATFPLQAQDLREVPVEELERVIPDADRFAEREGSPPVFRAYRSDAGGEEVLVGYAFLTSDVPPEVMGYDAPIDVLVGMDPEGALTGVRVMRYRESLQRSRGHFLGTRGFQEQFAGKHVRDPFRVRRDVRNISGATISVDAMARGIRNAARRVASAHVFRSANRESAAGGEGGMLLDIDTLERASWAELLSGGWIRRLTVLDGDIARLELFLTHVGSPEVGEVLLGPERFAEAVEQGGDDWADRPLLFLGLEGSTIRFRPYLLFLVQDGDTVSVDGGDLALFDDPRAGKVADQLRRAGLWAIGGEVDVARPFEVVFGGGLGMDVFSTEVPARPNERVVAETPPGGPPEDGSPADDAERSAAPEAPETVETEVAGAEAGGNGATEAPEGIDEEERADAAEGGAETAGEASVEPETPPPGESGAVPETTPGEEADRRDAAAPALPPELDFGQWGSVEEEETAFARTLARTSWSRVGGLALLLVLAMAAFLTKRTALRRAALAGTLVYLGFVHGGFLSVSHITSAIGVGAGVYLNDLALLLIVLFTLATTLLWGRVFCGYLCPFGALQDLLDRIVPRRFKRRVPAWIHDRALLVKYGVLLLVLTPALIGSHVSLYQYFEPFGTVFFLSPSLLLWTIAVGFLAASAVVPRFYCRYACPLGAALAVVSRISPLRIRRVEQCTVCKVCEHACPTGAIRGARVDFPECVRCSVCEVKLIERAGTCRHEMEGVRPRLVQLEVLSEGNG